METLSPKMGIYGVPLQVRKDFKQAHNLYCQAHLDLGSSPTHWRVKPYESRDMDSPLGQD